MRSMCSCVPQLTLSKGGAAQNGKMNVLQRLTEAIAANEALDKAGDRVSEALDKAMEKVPQSTAVKDFLHGKWLGHPLHPILTDLPIGAWTFAVVLDAADAASGERSDAPKRAIAFGMLAAVPTALSGAMDWHHTGGGPRRVGVAHALLNNAALGLFGASLALRSKNIALARVMSAGGLGLVGVSGYLGGHLISNMRIGVKHEGETPEEPVVLADASLDGALPEDTPRRIEVDGAPLVVVKHGGRTFVLSDVCPHLGCSLSEGTVAGDGIVCPCHGSTFALEDGRVLHGPSAFPVSAYRSTLPAADRAPGPVLDPGME